MATQKPQNSLSLAYQQRWHNDKSQFKMGAFPRRSGKSLMVAGEVVEDCLLSGQDGKPRQWLVLCPSKKDAQHLSIDMVRVFFHYRAPPLVKEGFPVSITTPGGSKITVGSAAPDILRGRKSGSVSVAMDEFACFAGLGDIWRVLGTFGWEGQRLIAISSPPTAKSHRLACPWEGVEWSRHKVDIHQAIADGLPTDAADTERLMAPEDWRNEFLLEEVDFVYASDETAAVYKANKSFFDLRGIGRAEAFWAIGSLKAEKLTSEQWVEFCNPRQSTGIDPTRTTYGL